MVRESVLAVVAATASLAFLAGIYVHYSGVTAEFQSEKQYLQERIEQLNKSLANERREVDRLESQIERMDESDRYWETRYLVPGEDIPEIGDDERIFSTFTNWEAVNGSNTTYRFTTTIYNVGGSDATDIELICGIRDDSEFLFVSTREVGTVPAGSGQFIEATFSVPESVMSTNYGGCRIRRCGEDCVNLERLYKPLQDDIEAMENTLPDSNTTASRLHSPHL